MTDCTIRDCPDDGVVLQERVNIQQSPEPPPLLIMSNCTIAGNANGSNVYFGSGMLRDNVINSNANIGLFVTRITPSKRLLLSGNKVYNNGLPSDPVGRDIVVQGRTLFDKCVILKDNNELSRPAYILSDAQTAIVTEETLAECRNSHLR